MKMLTAEGLQKLLQKVKTVFATKTEVNAIVNDLQSPSSTTGQSFVHTTGNETIAGTKTFSSTISGTADKALKDGSGNTIISTYVKNAGDTMSGILTVQNANIKVKDTGITRASSTTAKYPFALQLVDNGNNTLGGVYFTYGTDKATKTHLMCYKGTTNSSSDWSYIGIGYNGSGGVYTYAPTPATASNDTNIATTAFVKAQGYITSSGSITGSSGSCTGNAATATKIQRAPGGSTYVAAAQAGNALINSTTTGYGAVWNAPTKNYRVAMSTYPSSNDQILWYSITNANISAGTNTVAKSMNWDAGTGTLTATKFSGPLSGNVTGNVTGNCSGTAANVTGTVAIANGGTGATTRLKALQALTNENVGTNAQYFLTITSSWGKGGYSSTANAKTVLGVTGSDRRIKDDIEEIPDEVLDAWDSVKWNQFRMKKEVRQKGDEAPLHFGSIVQDVQKALSNGGIDPDRYGFLYHEDYLPEEMELPSEENPEITNGEKWYLKYAEALSIEAAYLRRRCKRLEKSLEDALNRISALEAKGD